MNRRQFTASLGAVSGTPALPFTSAQAVIAATVTPIAPPKAYAWAQLIARAQATTSPAKLARLLRVSPDVAQDLFDNQACDGILRTPSAAGIAQASHPLQTTGHSATMPKAIRTRLGKLMDQTKQAPHDPPPLVKSNDPALVCSETAEKDHTDACTCEPLQESPRCG